MCADPARATNRKASGTRAHVWPAVRLGLAAEIAAMVAELGQTQWLSAEDIASRQMGQLRTLLEFVGSHSPFYQGHAASVSGPIDSIRELPLVTRADVQTAGEDFYCRDVPSDQGKIRQIQTAGSTGEPVRIRKTGICQLLWQANMLRIHDWHGIPYGSRYSVIRPGLDGYGEQKDWGAPFSLLYRTGKTQLIPVSTPLNEQIALLGRFQPEVVQLMPNNLRGLVDLWRTQGMNLTELKFIRTIGETLPEELRQTVAALDEGIELVDGYSSQECGSIALQCPEVGGYHVNSESLIVEVLDEHNEPCTPGMIGRIVVTDLHNLASPLVRYEIGDYAQLGEPCSCGRGLTKLDRVMGRGRNLVVKPNGERHWPVVGYQEISTIVPLRQFQMIQETGEQITVLLVTDEPLTAEQKSAITTAVQKALRYPFELDIRDQRERLPIQPGGKFENFVSRVS